jgi:hypothetical protein
MRRPMSKAIAATLVALVMALCSISPFHPGFRPGFAGFRPGFGRRFVFHRGFFRNGVFISGWWGPAVVTSAWWGGYDSCWTYRPVYDGAGAYLGYSYVNICS